MSSGWKMRMRPNRLRGAAPGLRRSGEVGPTLSAESPVAVLAFIKVGKRGEG